MSTEAFSYFDDFLSDADARTLYESEECEQECQTEYEEPYCISPSVYSAMKNLTYEEISEEYAYELDLCHTALNSTSHSFVFCFEQNLEYDSQIGELQSDLLSESQTLKAYKQSLKKCKLNWNNNSNQSFTVLDAIYIIILIFIAVIYSHSILKHLKKFKRKFIKKWKMFSFNKCIITSVKQWIYNTYLVQLFMKCTNKIKKWIVMRTLDNIDWYKLIIKIQKFISNKYISQINEWLNGTYVLLLLMCHMSYEYIMSSLLFDYYSLKMTHKSWQTQLSDLMSEKEEIQNMNKQFRKQITNYEMRINELCEENAFVYQHCDMQIKQKMSEFCVENTRLKTENNSLKMELHSKAKELQKIKGFMHYSFWTAQDFIEWIMGLENGRFRTYETVLFETFNIEQICGRHIDGLTKSDIYRFGIQNIDDKKALFGHISQLIKANKRNTKCKYKNKKKRDTYKQCSKSKKDSKHKQKQTKNEKTERNERFCERIFGEEIEHFCCPITNEVMSDPVCISVSGHSYQRSAITKWIELNEEPKDPFTQKQIGLEHIIENRTLKEIIQKWKDREIIIINNDI